MIYRTNPWLTATVALSTSCCGAAMAADLTVGPGNTQVIDGSAAFPGGVDVNGGTLVVGGNGGGAGVTLGGNVNATANGTVSGFGTIDGNLDVTGARVAPGYPVGTPTGVSNGNIVVKGDLSLNNAVFDFETGYAGLPITQPGTGDNLTVAGNVALNNTTLNVSVNTLGVNAGYYRILSYGGTLSGNGLTLGTVSGDSVPAATIQSLTGDKQINVILGPATTNLWNGNGAASATRAGGGDGTWSAASGNWNSPANASGALPDGGYAIFTGAAGTVTVDGGAGAVRVSGIQFATDRYTLQGAPITLVGSGGNPPALVVGDGTYASGQFVDTIHNPLQGTQGFVKTGPGSLILTADSSGLSGPILIADGALEIDGKLNGPLDIGREVVLAGVGQVGATTLYPTAVISPGNDGSPIGTLTVNGNLAFGADTVYRVHADPASSASDRIHVTGIATLDGTVAHVGPAGNYAPRATYNILTADGGIQGRFAGASSAYAFLTPTLSYDANNAFMTLTRNDVPIGSIGSGGNESSVGDALDKEDPPASGSGSPVLDSGNGSARDSGARQVTTAVLAMTADQARSALKLLAGEAHASTATVLQGQADTVRALPLEHLRGNLDAPLRAGQPTAQLGSPSADALPQSGAAPVWAQAFGNWSTFDGDGNASRIKQSAGGLFVGGDGAVGGGWRLGGALGYTGSHNSIAEAASRSDVDSYTATLFGGRNIAAGPGHVRFMAGAAYTWHNIDTRRDVAAGGLNQQLKSSYHAASTQVFSELGYHLPLGEAYAIEPFAGVAWNQLRTHGFEESGGSAALRGKGRTDDVTSTTLGLRGSWQFDSHGAPGRLTASLGWRHAMGDVTPSQELAFDGGSTFSVRGVPIARNAAVAGLGAEMAITRNTTVGVAYDAQFGGGNRQQSGQLKLALRF
ncbi:hypothetical protein LMG26788_00675 [Achromobacter pulmonis]|uniref:Autotransporter domain-containing protein n=1 Tax=Achromobacter pulmonis TaxID=1389932 RepID=A0A6S7C2A9_9BURK|nr:autotransporter domain-containing protein [Achromobacter pulmonis]CAB3829114.1 hypothetical protein LMG26788_00675 [Achromobacter pulmonis]